MIPFVVGPRSPSGLQAQLQAEERLQEQMANAPRALGPLIAINISTVFNRSKDIKALLTEEFMDIDDRVMENYSLLLSMGVEVSGHHQKFQIASKLCLLKSELLFKKGLSKTCCRDGRSFTNKLKVKGDYIKFAAWVTKKSLQKEKSDQVNYNKHDNLITFCCKKPQWKNKNSVLIKCLILGLGELCS